MPTPSEQIIIGMTHDVRDPSFIDYHSHRPIPLRDFPMIYLDNAATSFPKPEPVYQALDRLRPD